MPSQPTISPDTKGSPKSSDDASTRPGVPSGGSPAPVVSPPSHTVTPLKPPPSTPSPGPTATADPNVHQPTGTSTQGAATWTSAGGERNTHSPSGSSASQPPNTSAQGVPPQGTTNPTQNVKPNSPHIPIRPAHTSTAHSTLTESPTKPMQSPSSSSVVPGLSSDTRNLTTTTHKSWFPTPSWVKSTKPNNSNDASPTKNTNPFTWTTNKPFICGLLDDCATSSQSSTARGHIPSTSPNPSERSRSHDSQTAEPSTVHTGKSPGTSHGVRPYSILSFGPGPEILTTVLDTTTFVSSTTSSSTTSNNNHPATSKSSQTHHPSTTSSPPSPDKPSPTGQSPTPKNSSPHRAPSPQTTTLSTVEPTSPSPLTSQPTSTSSEHNPIGPEVTQPGTASQPTSTGDGLITSNSRASESTNPPSDSNTNNVQASSTSSSYFANTNPHPDQLIGGDSSGGSSTPQGSIGASTTTPQGSSVYSSMGSFSSSHATSSFASSATLPLGTPASHSKGTSNAALIDGIVGGIVGLILLGIIIYFIFRRKKRQNLHDQEASAPLSPSGDEELVTQFTPYNQLFEPTTGVGYTVFYPDASNSYVSIHRSNDQEMDTVLSSSDSSFEPETPLPPSPFYPNDSTETIQAIPGLDSPPTSIFHEENNDAIDYEADESSGVPYTTSNPISFYPSVMATASSSAFYSARQTESSPETFYATPRESMDSLSTLQPDTRVVESNPSTISLVGFQVLNPAPMSSPLRNPFVVSEANESQADESRLHVKTESEQERDWTASLSAPTPSPASSEGPSIASGSKNPYYNYLKALKTQGTSGQPPSSWGMRNVFAATSRLSTASSALEVPDSESQCGIAM